MHNAQQSSFNAAARGRRTVDKSSRLAQLSDMKLEQYLARKKLNQSQFADLIGSHKSTVSRLVRGLTWPDKETLRRIRQVTGGAVSANDFLGEEAP